MGSTDYIDQIQPEDLTETVMVSIDQYKRSCLMVRIKITYLNDGEFCIVKKDNVEFFDEKGNKVNKKVLKLSISKGGASGAGGRDGGGPRG